MANRPLGRIVRVLLIIEDTRGEGGVEVKIWTNDPTIACPKNPSDIDGGQGAFRVGKLGREIFCGANNPKDKNIQ
ncbi:MAG: hypothetical protein IMW96_03380 [Thermoanaerobacteraceae bacterium]|nr:hypothetical protein [Thermoanaerobacteraceae bacterium]